MLSRLRAHSPPVTHRPKRRVDPRATRAEATRIKVIAQAVAACAAIGSSLAGDVNAAVLSPKRGFADVGANYGNLQATGAGWYYTWGTGAANPANFDAKHYPMFWGGTPSQGAIDNVKARNPEYVLGF